MGVNTKLLYSPGESDDPLARLATRAVTSAGDVIEPDEGIATIGSGGSFALAAARALIENTDLGAREIAEKSLRIAGQICIYTNDQITIEELSA